ncbi:BMC_2a_G0011580.mRNA.1.CDS.1 [Saccharomyces cerevisiae]|nr:Zip1p [Saccharomyces cerevisiae YJM1447]CAI4355191.1 BMC_2a_G0011580.mRNA.1.CDS.1 [Saccharomyces cerevisiae]CAI4359299.1 BMB_G0011550.mRNA.1.CDS.1 [Saccharomyces cerevisiae]CAI7078000.1 BMC_2a_G0011580.mRNA.1.CDS.1 [Saccharomyces cerevisiae]CAI7079204.1 BMB_G0011550.mRNA.1.CDS.1 [Saccharomyces cerevisiae]
MSNFFRDSSMGFKPRPNIFAKLRVRDVDSDSSANTVVENSSNCLDVGSSIEGDDTFKKPHKTSTEQELITSMSLSQRNHGYSDDMEIGSPKKTTSTDQYNRILKNDVAAIENDTDEDFEITEVREVSEGVAKETKESHGDPNDSETTLKDSKMHEYTMTNGKAPLHTSINNSSTSSNDVLLEAFTNTQRICSNLKQELQKQQQDNAKLKVRLQSYASNSDKINEKVGKYKSCLETLQERIATLTSHKNNQETKLKDLRQNHQLYQRRISGFKTSIENLNKTINDLGKHKKEADAELMKKGKEIEYLKRELDDCSGQLSEEKIKNSSLIQEMGKNREEMIKSIENFFSEDKAHHLLQFNKFEERIHDLFENKLQKHFDVAKDTLNVGLRNTTVELSSNTETMLKQQYEDIKENLEQKMSSSKDEMATTINELSVTQKGLIMGVQQELLTSSGNIQTALVSEMNNTRQELLDDASQTAQNYASLENLLKAYKAEIVQSNEYEERIKHLESERSTLSSQKNQIISSLGTKEAQYEDLVKKLEAKNIEISQISGKEQSLTEKNDNLSNELKKVQDQLEKLNNLNITTKSNYENKISSQNEIVKALVSENDTLKQRIQQLVEIKENEQKDHTTKLEAFQKNNVQLQKLNVEVVQLKAHELELEEQNRHLKNCLEKKETGVEESLSDVKTLKQQVIVLKSEKQDITAEKLELQDNLESLEEVTKNLQQKMQSQKRELEQKIKELEEIKNHKRNEPSKKGTQNFTKPSDSPKKNATTSNLFPNNSAAIHSPMKKCPKVDHISKSRINSSKETSKFNDEFDLSSSSNDDLELTNPSPIQIKPVRGKIKKGSNCMKPPISSRKKLLLVEDEDQSLKISKKRRRK